MTLVSFMMRGRGSKRHPELISPAGVLNFWGVLHLFWESESDKNYDPFQKSTYTHSFWSGELLEKQTLKQCFLSLPRWTKDKVAVWGRYTGVLRHSQPVEEWGHHQNRGRLWAHMCYAGWKRCSEIHLWVRWAVETPEQHPPGEWMDRQWHLIHENPASPPKGTEHSLLGTRSCPGIHRKA